MSHTVDPLDRLSDLASDLRKIFKTSGGDESFRVNLIKARIKEVRKTVLLLPNADGRSVLQWYATLSDFDAQYFALVNLKHVSRRDKDKKREAEKKKREEETKRKKEENDRKEEEKKREKEREEEEKKRKDEEVVDAEALTRQQEDRLLATTTMEH